MCEIRKKLRLALLNEENGIKPLDFQTNNMNVGVSDEDKMKVKNLKWNDIELIDLPSSDNARFKFKVKLPFENNFEDEIKVVIEVKGGILYHLDMALPNALQGLELGPKIYKNIIMDFGHLYASKARIHNDNIYKLLGKMKNDPDIECVDGKSSTLCSYKNNPDKEKLFKIMAGL